MRTIRFTLNARLDPDTNIGLSTELILDEEHEDVQEAGRRAGDSLLRFLAGVNESFKGDDEPA